MWRALMSLAQSQEPEVAAEAPITEKAVAPPRFNKFCKYEEWHDKVRYGYYNNLPEELQLQLLSYLGPTDLLQAARVSRVWNRYSQQNVLWEKHCEALWEDKLLPPSTKAKLMEEKASCKSRYYLSVRDSRREIITTEELLSFLWQFNFRLGIGSSAMESTAFFKPSVRVNQTLGHDLPWKFVDVTVQKGSERHVVHRLLQIASYPPYRFDRDAHDWGWHMLSECAEYKTIKMRKEAFEEHPGLLGPLLQAMAETIGYPVFPPYLDFTMISPLV
eukprot:g14452.t1